jgi:hypothetical protein
MPSLNAASRFSFTIRLQQSPGSLIMNRNLVLQIQTS